MKITTLLTRCTLLIFLFSCKEESEEQETVTLHRRLISCTISQALTEEEFMKITPEAYDKMYSPAFNPKTDTIRYSNDTIYISYLSITNGCANNVGDINIGDDSIIYLRLINLNDYVCTEIGCDRIQFKIKNPKKKKYKIMKA